MLRDKRHPPFFSMKALASGCVDGVPARTDTQTFARQDGMSKKAGEAGLRIPSAIAGVPKARSNRLSYVVACTHIPGKRRCVRACLHAQKRRHPAAERKKHETG